MSFYGEDSPTDATETRRKYLQKWDDKLDAYAYNDRNDLKATDGACARVRRSHDRSNVSLVVVVGRAPDGDTMGDRDDDDATKTARARGRRDVDPDANDD